LQQRDLWAMELLNWEKMVQQEAYKVLQMEQWVETSSQKIKTTRCPIRINGEKLFHAQAAPALGAHNQKIATEFGL